MNLQFYLEKLHDSDEFKKFREENPNAHLCSGFFVIDKEGKDNKTHLDFFNPEANELISFQLHEEIKKIPLDNFDKRTFEEISLELNFDFNEVEELIQKEMKKREIKSKIQKTIFSLQKQNNEEILFGTIFITGFGLLKTSISLKENKILDFEKKSFFDMVKIVKNKKD